MTDKINLNIYSSKSRNRNIPLRKNFTDSRQSKDLIELNNLVPSLNFSKIYKAQREMKFFNEKNSDNFQLQTLPNFRNEEDNKLADIFEDLSLSFLDENIPISILNPNN